MSVEVIYLYIQAVHHIQVNQIKQLWQATQDNGIKRI